MMKCPICNKIIKEESKFCRYCGKAISVVKANDQDEATKIVRPIEPTAQETVPHATDTSQAIQIIPADPRNDASTEQAAEVSNNPSREFPVKSRWAVGIIAIAIAGSLIFAAIYFIKKNNGQVVQFTATQVPWDRDQNIRDGVKRFLDVLNESGMRSVGPAVRECYENTDKQTSKSVLKLQQFEYCIGMDWAAKILNDGVYRSIGVPSREEYFFDNAILRRLHRISEWYPNANEEKIALKDIRKRIDYQLESLTIGAKNK